MNFDSPTKWQVVVLALGDLGATSKVVDTEQVAVRAHQFAPNAFSWRLYPEHIDLDSVRVSLTDACKKKYGSLVTGSVRQGWNLTPVGVEWLAEHGTELRRALEVAEPDTNPAARQSTKHAAREASRLKTSGAYRAWLDGKSPNSRSVRSAFRIDIYTSPRDRELKANRLREIADQLEDEDLMRFVQQMTPVLMEEDGPRFDGSLTEED